MPNVQGKEKPLQHVKGRIESPKNSIFLDRIRGWQDQNNGQFQANPAARLSQRPHLAQPAMMRLG